MLIRYMYMLMLSIMLKYNPAKGNNTIPVFVRDDDTLFLNCPGEKQNVYVSWFGPPNLLLYSQKKQVNSFLRKRNRVAVISLPNKGKYCLQITNVSLKDTGVYRCTTINDNIPMEQFDYNVQLAEIPSNVTILQQSDYGKITGVENHELSLTCTVTAGRPRFQNETISWTYGGHSLLKGPFDSLTYRIYPTFSRHMHFYRCIVYSPLLRSPVIKTVQLNVLYKPKTRLNSNSTIQIVEGKHITIECSSDSNPRTTEIFWRLPNKTIVYNNSGSTSSLDLMTVNRRQEGYYECISMNMIGAGKAELHLVVQYPPNVMIIHDTFTINKDVRILECKPDGFPNVYQFDRWEHKSFFVDHIRYLNASSGVLILPNHANMLSKFERYQDSGVYVCAVNNGIPDQNGDINQQGQTSVRVKGMPVFVSSNEPNQKGKMDNFAFLTVHLISNPKYDDVFCSTNNWNLSLKNNPHNFKEEESIIRDFFHSSEVLVHGFTVTFKTVQMKKNNFHNYTFTAVNKYGSASYNICLVENVREKEQLTDIQGSVIFLITAGAILSSIIVNLFIMVLYKRCKRRHSIQLSNEVQALYDEINESEQVNINGILQNQRSTIQEPSSPNIIRSFSQNLSSSSSSKSDHVYLEPITSFVQSENYVTLGIMKVQTPYKIRDKISQSFSLTCVATAKKIKSTQEADWKSSRQYHSAEF